jgi:hypothetical protein
MAIENDIYLDNSNIMVLEVMCKIEPTWLKIGPTPCRVLARNQ